jgi:NodT family efflux transporter outer membrane factor (OMF) lipoprotein
MIRGLPPNQIGAVLGLVTLTIGACTVGPSYRKPEIPTPQAYAEAADTARSVVRADDADLSRWWTQINDRELEDLIRRALAGNLDLQTAASRVRQARLQEIIAGAREYPSLSAGGSAVTLNSNRASGGQSAARSPVPGHLNFYSVGFDATWEVDLFGGVRRSVEEAKANTDADRWARRDGEVTLTAEVATDYLTLRAVQARIGIGHAELARQQDLFVLIGARRKAGFVTNLDVNQQATLVNTSAAQIPQLEAQAKTQIHALGVLLGEPPEALESELAVPPTDLPPPPPALPTGLPSALLRRRPDVREAEGRLAASSAEIGVQTANLFPKLDLYAFGGFGSMTPDKLFSAQNLTSAALGMLSQPIFEGGRLRASVGVAKEENAQAMIAYRRAVLGALRDVEDALARFRSDEDRRQSLAHTVQAATASRAIAQDQYRTGLVTFVNVLQSEYAVLNAEDQLAQADAQSLSDVVALYKALGGGWAS